MGTNVLLSTILLITALAIGDVIGFICKLAGQDPWDVFQ